MRRILSRRPVQRASADQVQVDVEHGLARVAVGVEEDAESAGGDAAVLRDRRRAPHQLADDRVVVRRQVVERGDVLLRNDEHMRRTLRIDVVEREHAVVFVDDRRGDLASGDFAEEAVGHTRFAIATRGISCRSRRRATIVSPRAREIKSATASDCPKPNSNTRCPPGARCAGAFSTRRRIVARPSAPANSASPGSYRPTSAWIVARSPSGTYGGLDTIRSYCSCTPSKRSPPRNWMRDATPCRSALRRATAVADAEMSIAVTAALGRSCAIDTAMQPLPVPTSHTVAVARPLDDARPAPFAPASRSSSAISTINSVSGRG